jgi:hypothetical protein
VEYFSCVVFTRELYRVITNVSALFSQVYYYNARTRESAWSKPENVKILTQQEVEAMAANNQDGPPGHNNTPTSAASSIPVSGHNSMPHDNSGRNRTCQVYLLEVEEKCHLCLVCSVLIGSVMGFIRQLFS